MKFDTRQSVLLAVVHGIEGNGKPFAVKPINGNVCIVNIKLRLYGKATVHGNGSVGLLVPNRFVFE